MVIQNLKTKSQLRQWLFAVKKSMIEEPFRSFLVNFGVGFFVASHFIVSLYFLFARVSLFSQTSFSISKGK